MKIYFGIDIGKSGGIVGIKDGKVLVQAVMPIVGGEDVDVVELGSIIRGAELMVSNRNECAVASHVVIERFAGWFGYNKSSAASVSRQAGAISAMLVLNGFAHTAVVPRTWQKAMFEGTRELKNKDGKRATKEMAAITASRLFPKESFKPSTKYKNPHDGIVDAALLALFGERKGF